MTDTRRYPSADIVNLYAHCWEIELGYREMKQHLMQNRLTLRSKKKRNDTPGVVGRAVGLQSAALCYGKDAYSLKSVEPNQLSFSQSYGLIIKERTMLPAVSPGKVPAVIRDKLAMAKVFVLPHRSERCYPRAVKRRPYKYPVKKNASQLN